MAQEAGSREWEKLSTTMDAYHTHFKQSYRQLSEQAGQIDTRAELEQLLRSADALVSHLHAHHSIEEHYLFPLLAKATRDEATFGRQGSHVSDHTAMSKAMSKLARYVQECRDDPARYHPGQFREHLGALGTVLLRHLDDEVASLKGSRLRESGMTLAALRQLPL